MDKSEKYDIKEASNPSLKPSARRNYADNAESNAKGVKQTAKQRAKLPAKVVAAIAAKKGAPKQIKPKRSKVPSNKGKTGDGSKVGNKPMKKGRKDTGSPKMKGPYMESNAQEKKNLLTVESWMSKFSQSRM